MEEPGWNKEYAQMAPTTIVRRGYYQAETFQLTELTRKLKEQQQVMHELRTENENVQVMLENVVSRPNSCRRVAKETDG